MEALTAVTVAALTIYDMCKAIDREMTISDVKLMKKWGKIRIISKGGIITWQR